MIGGLILAFLLGVDALRRVYSVGRTWNDHFVAAVVLGCMGFYALQWLSAPVALRPLWGLGILWIWGLFFALGDQRGDIAPKWALWAFAWPSQLAYAFALWGGLTWLIRAPIAWALGADPWWAGPWLLIPAVLAVAGQIQAMRPQPIRRHAVQGLPARIVQLSDLHASPVMAQEALDALVDRVNGLEPALVCITGDLVMPFSEARHDYLLRALARLQAPVVCCPGNHDLPVLTRLQEALEAEGIALLADQKAHRAGFEVVGFTFRWGDAADEVRLTARDLAGAKESFRVWLAHDPRVGGWLEPGSCDLLLSGHSHGGQVGLNMFGLRPTLWGLLGHRDQGWWEAGGAPHYVHAGNWWIGLPPRMGVSGEIAVFEPGEAER